MVSPYRLVWVALPDNGGTFAALIDNETNAIISTGYSEEVLDREDTTS